ncbi:MAG: FtsQ-type POTRA domain-containing protein [Eubacteriaceae bacterium]|nr:FtsQ-type POTRA domain-containing protein [Eubacteriaceae bacterium]
MANIAVEKEENKRKRKPVAIKLMLAILVASVAIAAFVRSDFFTIKQISVEGATTITADEIIDVSGLAEVEQIFSFNASKVTSEILKQLPRVGMASVDRYLPDKLVIRISEREPILYIKQQSGYFAVDRNYMVFSKTPIIEVASTILVTGLEKLEIDVGKPFLKNQTAQTQTFARIVAFLEDRALCPMVSEIYISPKAYYIYTRNSSVVRFFSYSAFKANEEFLESFIPYDNKGVMVEVVDGAKPVYKLINIE